MAFAEFFLKEPGNFPSAPGGAPWGVERVDIALAGLSFRFEGLSHRQADYVRERYADFLTVPARGETAIVTVLYRADPASFRPIDVHPWTYALDLDYQASCVRIAGLQLMTILDWAPELRTALWSATEDDRDFRLVFENVFRTVTAYALLQRGGVLLHSAGISDGEMAWVGFGHSGAGKSTLSRLTLDAGRQVLSDDINALCRESGQWRAQRIPFAGELGPTYGQKGSYSLVGLCRLDKGPAHRLEPLERATAVAALLASAPYVNQDPYRVADLMTTLESLSDAVPCYRLTFARNPGFWPLLQAAPIHVHPRWAETGRCAADPETVAGDNLRRRDHDRTHEHLENPR